MLDSYLLSGFGVVEHNQHDGFIAAVLSAMHRADHLDECLTFTEGAFCTVLADDSQVALLYYTVINHRMVMPACFGTYGKIQPQHAQLGRSLRKIRKQGTVPAPGCTNQFSCLDSHSLIRFAVQKYEKKSTFPNECRFFCVTDVSRRRSSRWFYSV